MTQDLTSPSDQEGPGNKESGLGKQLLKEGSGRSKVLSWFLFNHLWVLVKEHRFAQS